MTGKLRWLPDYFLLQTLSDTVLAVDGYLDEREEDERSLRRHAAFCIAPYVEKGFTIEKYWPIRGDEQIKVEQNKEQRMYAKLLKYKQKALAKNNGDQT